MSRLSSIKLSDCTVRLKLYWSMTFPSSLLRAFRWSLFHLLSISAAARTGSTFSCLDLEEVGHEDDDLLSPAIGDASKQARADARQLRRAGQAAKATTLPHLFEVLTVDDCALMHLLQICVLGLQTGPCRRRLHMPGLAQYHKGATPLQCPMSFS